MLLPASVAADLVFFSLHVAGKLPVLLNWTTGPANLAHAVATLNIRHVVTSRKLIDRLGIQVPGAEYAFLEDLRASVGRREAVTALLASYLFPSSFLRDLPRPGIDEPAVVLFTSGSENVPKAVPLSHGNLIHNVRASLAVLQATRADAMLGFLPPFHSFGLTGTVIAPILSGFRVVHHPDPTDARGLVRTAAAYQTSLLVTTPTFLSYMLTVAAPEDLRALRIVITGAEKCPESLFARTRELAPQATILEGYGITECSPVVSGNWPGRIKPGTVGQPVDGVEVCVVHPESRHLLPANTTGLLLVRGPSIFQGYLNYDGPDPFVEVAGKRWYVTGDLVELDSENYIHFRGRLKRFLKVGGEMVSLPALEEPFPHAVPAHRERTAAGGGRHRDPRRALDRAVQHRGHPFASGECSPGRSRLSRRDAIGRGRSRRRDPGPGHGEDGLQGSAPRGGRTGAEQVVLTRLDRCCCRCVATDLGHTRRGRVLFSVNVWPRAKNRRFLRIRLS